MSTDERLNILLVDDQAGKLLTYETILRDLGENLLKATSASQALECLLKNEIAVVLVDVCMPDLDGYELAAMIREHPRHQKTSIIFVSAVLMTDLDRLRGYQCGAVDYVPVPVVPDILRAKVSVFVDLYRKTRQLERLNLELEQRVAARTEQLESFTARLQANEERLEEADRRKDEFLAMLAHELRNPLAPIRNAVEVLRAEEASEAQRSRAREIIERQVEHMVRLIDDLMDVSRISRGMITLRREAVDVRALAARSIEAARPAIESRHHELTAALPDGPVAIFGDEIRLTQIVANLLNNAAKYTDPGGRVRLGISTEGGEVVISVRDSGIGFARENADRLFDMFAKFGRANDTPASGLGIGLALVQRLAQMHGGRVEAHSDGPGFGSEFVVRLPALADAGADPRADEARGPVTRRVAARRILVADDNKDAAEALSLLLRAAGHDVRIAYDGHEAVEIAEAFRPDVALLDVGMPRLGGCEAADRIRRQAGDRPVALIAITGWGHQQDRARTAAAGFDAHLVKPVGEAELLAALDRCAASRGATQIG